MNTFDFHSTRRHKLVRDTFPYKDRNVVSMEPLKWGEAYTDAASIDLQNTLASFWKISRPNDPTLFPTTTIRLIHNDSLIFDAWATLTDDQYTDLSISKGVLSSLDDFFVRLSCNYDFFSNDLFKKRRLWTGCECLWLKSGMFTPVTRFFDYRQNLTSMGSTEPGVPSQIAFFGTYFCGIPSDNSRYHLATNMVAIGLAWILMHEEAHHWHGHLHYAKAFASSKPYRADAERMSETRKTWCAQEESDLRRKVFEWSADREATRAIYDVFFRPGMVKVLPDYCEKDPTWLFRLIVTSIGCVMLMFDKARFIYGSPNNYPTPRTRMFSMMRIMYGKFMHTQSGGDAIPRPIFSREQLISAFFGSVRDLWVASELLKNENDVKEKRGGPLQSQNVSMDLFGDETDFHGFLQALLLGVDNDKGWSTETDDLISALDSEIFDLMRPYRCKAGSRDIFEGE